MYNGRIKELFLDSLNGKYAKGTIKIYRNILNKSGEIEEIYNKDIANFNAEQCRQLLQSFSNRSREMFAVNRSCLETYESWAISNGHNETLINCFSNITIDNADEYIDHRAIAKKITTYDELLNFEKIVINPQDLLSLVCPFIGAYGKEAKEIINLKVEDLHEDYIQLDNRKLPVDSRIHAIIQDAIDQDEYYVGNGEPDDYVRAPMRVINKTQYILRFVGSTKFEQGSYNLVKGRIDRLKKYCGNNISITNLILSGKVHMAKEIMKEKGEITKEDWMSINERFGITGDKILDYWTVTKEKVMPYLN